MITGLVPIGTVVLLKNSSKRVMVIGFCQTDSSADGNGEMWDYAGCLYPEGYIGADRTFLFNGDQIEKIFAIGYQDEEQFEFKVHLDAAYGQLKNPENQQTAEN